ncbi:MAG: response regulator [Anaerovoracaceae bacterium]|jgi:two-component system LytT family response regulator
MRIALIDDEPSALELLEIMLSSYENIQVVGRYVNPMHALAEIDKLDVNVVFLDIEMGEINGLQVGDMLLEKKGDMEIVFVTAYSQYAIEAFEIQAMDYLLKPIHEKRLDKTIKRLRVKFQNKDMTDKPDEAHVSVSSFGGFHVHMDQENPFVWRTKKAKELFAYLFIKGREGAGRTEIIEDVFYDKNLEQATTLLHTTIYQIRKVLKKAGYPKGISYVNEGYRLDIPLVSDYEEINQILKQNFTDDYSMERVMEIHKGDFMAEGYHWALNEQNRYKKEVVRLLSFFAKNRIEDKRYGDPLKDCLDFLHDLDPFSEETANLIISYHGQQGQKDRLKEFYARYEATLKTEVGVGPSWLNRKLYLAYTGSC